MHDTSIKILEGKKRALEKGDDAVVHQIAEGRDIMSVLCKVLYFHFSLEVIFTQNNSES